MKTEVNSFEAAKAAFKAIDEKQGIDITVINISEVSVIADYFIIASASNSNQLKAMADEVEQQLYKTGWKLKYSEGFQSKTWILLDFGDIVVHLFSKEEREFYNIERIWADAKVVSEKQLRE